eukprot:Partr_v1_DN28839_c3_g1_i2_m34096
MSSSILNNNSLDTFDNLDQQTILDFPHLPINDHDFLDAAAFFDQQQLAMDGLGSVTMDNSADPMRSRQSSTSSGSGSGQRKAKKRAVSDKRAEQNRKAQKAFRLKKKEYLRDLEATAAEAEKMRANLAYFMEENARLHRLVESLSTSAPSAAAQQQQQNWNLQPAQATSSTGSDVSTTKSSGGIIASPALSLVPTTDGESVDERDDENRLSAVPPAFGGSVPFDMNASSVFDYGTPSHDLPMDHSPLFGDEVGDSAGFIDAPAPPIDIAAVPEEKRKAAVVLSAAEQYSYREWRVRGNNGSSTGIGNDKSVARIVSECEEDQRTDDEEVFTRVHETCKLKKECAQLKDTVVETICDLMEKTTCRDNRFDGLPRESMQKFWSRLLVYASVEVFDKKEEMCRLQKD